MVLVDDQFALSAPAAPSRPTRVPSAADADLPHVIARFPIGRHGAADTDRPHPARRCRRPAPAARPPDTGPAASGDTSCRPGCCPPGRRDRHAQRPGRGRHQLHEAHGAFRRSRARIESRLDLDDRAHELGTKRPGETRGRRSGRRSAPPSPGTSTLRVVRMVGAPSTCRRRSAHQSPCRRATRVPFASRHA